MTVHYCRGKHLDELIVGDVYAHRPARTVTEADNVLFSTLTTNTRSLHLDAEFAPNQELGQRLVNSLLTVSTVVGLSVTDLTEGTTVANLGFAEIRFPAHVFIDDTLTAETGIIDKRLSAFRPGQGVVTFEHRGRNQHGGPVSTARRAALVLRASPAAGKSG
ncbi:MaoC family dehydratase [Mycobacterium heckeshornense]|uniref:MaoC family dehydratase n=1 Tax=Mycobacterium heckeshornense TaxID=110505 RepID=UPI00066272E9|nr:MaoC family dehydratase [Mycobacterium heckeshornense]KMV16695.1 dehydratase [Mycobacterium heckeshornense]